ncbi:hypothetical protein BVX94_00340 [bacterium B17]|nr:hypothetical protein BVX94_00340 [bacterium B17]
MLLCCLPVSVLAEIDLIADIVPGAIIANYNADAFSLEGSQGKETMSLVSSVPSAEIGIAWQQPEGSIDLKAGVGALLNSRLMSYTMAVNLGLTLEMQPSIMIGPHIGMIYYSEPEWWGDGEITFSDSSGVTLGMHMNLGDKVAYMFSVDYYSAVFDIESIGAGWTTDQDELDMSGLAFRFGIRAQF